MSATDSPVVFSQHASAFDQPSGGFSTIEALFAALRSPSPDVVARVAKIRLLLGQGEKSAAKKVKTKLPAVTISGRFTAKGEDGFEGHSGFYVYDYDGLDDVEELMSAATAGAVDAIAGAFISPSGVGLKVVLQGPVAGSCDQHRQAWDAGLRVLRNAIPFEVAQTDEAREVSRLCYLSDCRESGSSWLADWYEPFAIGDGTRAVEAGEGGEAGDVGDLPGPSAVIGGLSLAEVEDRLCAISPDCGYKPWMQIVLSVVQTLGKTDESRGVVESWSQRRTAGAWDRDERKTFDTLWKNAEQREGAAGVDHHLLTRMARKAGWRDWFADLRRDVQKDGKVKIVACEYNIGLVLDHHPQLRGRIWCDEVTGALLLSPGKGMICHEGAVIEEHVAWTIVEWLQSKWMVKVTTAEGMMKAMFAKAYRNPRNKRREWMEGLKWDGRERIGGLWIEGFGAPDTPLNRAVAETWMIGAAARTLRPGIDFQLVPILQGPQGKGKSLGLAALCPGQEWFIDSQVDMRSKAGYEVVRTGTIIELAELAAMGRAEIEAVKAFVSHRSITFRSPYDRQTRTVAVSWVFVGTTNEKEVLKDSTGNRRFVPVAAPGRGGVFKNTVAWVSANRDQLWAEAVAKAKTVEGGVVLPEQYWETAREAAEEATTRDAAEDAIEELTDGTPAGSRLKMTDIMSLVPGGSMGNMADQKRVASYLHKYGWVRRTGRVEGRMTKFWEAAGNTGNENNL